MPSSNTPGITVPAPSEDGKAVPFRFEDPATGMWMDGFLIRSKGRLYAWRNQCRHVPLTLDFGDNQFFTEDNQFLLCRNHGALFEPDTGLCVSGPCHGASLFPLEVEECGESAIIRPPAGNTSVDLE